MSLSVVLQDKGQEGRKSYQRLIGSALKKKQNKLVFFFLPFPIQNKKKMERFAFRYTLNKVVILTFLLL